MSAAIAAHGGFRSLVVAGLLLTACARAEDIPPVGSMTDGATVVTTAQLVRPAGQTIEFAGRPVDLVLSERGDVVVMKDNRGLVVVDAANWSLRQELSFEGREGGSMFGLAMTRDGRHVLATSARNLLALAQRNDDGSLAWEKEIHLPGPKPKEAAFPCGIALAPDEQTAYVCLSRNNALGVVDLANGALTRQIEVGIAPYAVVCSPDGDTAYVSNWGGRRPNDDDKTSDSAGSDAVVDERGIAASGTVSIVDLSAGRIRKTIEVGLSPCGLALSTDGKLLYVACANSDTVAIIDTTAGVVLQSLNVRPDEKLPFGSMPNGVALAPDGQTLYVSLAGNNAVGVVRLGQRDGDGTGSARGRGRAGAMTGFIPAGWYPGALAVRGGTLYVANIKGVGSRTLRDPDKGGWNSHWHRGSATRVPVPDEATLSKYSDQVRRDARLPQVLTSREMSAAREDEQPVPVPARIGAPSVFEHVIYVIKENRTYDQVFGDLPQGNGDPNLCVFGRDVTPNHHALAEEFVLLDNYYCNGVLSADGHSWSTEGNVTPYLERSFGGFSRSYTFGNDPLTYSSSGFVWDHLLARGLSFRNYGEFDAALLEPDADYNTVLADWRGNTNKIQRKQRIGLATMRRYACPDYPGWNMEIPDVLRASVFCRELAEFEKNGLLPNFVIVYLPDDHTSGTAPGKPTPRALVADNDLALGRIIDAVSHSRFWPKTCIFVIEDDPQNGFDHVDGHRSLCLVVSPYSKRGEVVSQFYNQGSVLHTIERIFGIAAQAQLYAMSPLMTDCFADAPDLTPYRCRDNTVPLGELNKPLSELSPAERDLALASAALPLAEPDRADEDTLNRILWHSARGGDTPYPAEWAGSHGKGLAALGLRLDPRGGAVEWDDDD